MSQVRLSPRPRVHRSVVDTLARRILSGDIAPGEGLPNTQDLSAELGVSRSALREAIKVLTAKGMLGVRPRTGTRVLPRESWNLMDPELLAWCGPTMDADMLGALLECRWLIEPGAAALAADRASAADLAAIDQAFTRMASAPTLEERVAADLDFHLAVLRASGNLFLLQWAGTVSSVLLAAFRRSSGAALSLEAASSAHREIVEAIRLRDPARADRGMREVLRVAAADLQLWPVPSNTAASVAMKRA
ncbi:MULTISPECIES: FadR/GntR family transcriptional regulator [unclassified Acidisoma]|uniref:FadR/GntR family transcriptional regulator n=1 Tax=unclassified Acidisoma TaxID=2634065 RepID=UPI00131E91AD|nr:MULTISPECIES: FadR/GntR family transcriptional regulator [unclassified Acidisoma]